MPFSPFGVSRIPRAAFEAHNRYGSLDGETHRQRRRSRRDEGNGARPGPQDGRARRSPVSARPELDELRRSAGDLMSRSRVRQDVGVALCDLERPETFETALDQAEATLASLDIVVVTAAQFATQDRLEQDTGLTHRLLTVNFANTVTFCELSRKRLIARGGGTLCVFSSVAGERGRKRVVVYGAARAGLSRYLEGLDHRYRTEGLVTVCVKPGFVATSMTEGLPRPPFTGHPDAVAKGYLLPSTGGNLSCTRLPPGRS